jgi:single-strand DNA-binding protein
MANDFNHVGVIGNLVRDPELAFTQDGTAICKFAIANNRVYKSGDEKKEEVSYFNCIAWGRLGETIAEYMKKGSKVLVEGRLRQSRWEQDDGQKRSKVEITVTGCQFLTFKKDDGGSQAPAPPDTGSPFSDDEIPF